MTNRSLDELTVAEISLYIRNIPLHGLTHKYPLIFFNGLRQTEMTNRSLDELAEAEISL